MSEDVFSLDFTELSPFQASWLFTSLILNRLLSLHCRYLITSLSSHVDKCIIFEMWYNLMRLPERVYLVIAIN